MTQASHYIVNEYSTNYEIARSASLTAAVMAVAKARSCPFEELYTEQCGKIWWVYGPKRQVCANIVLDRTLA